MFVKPAEGVKVRDPRSKRHIPEGGVEVADTDIYWARRLRDGDVVATLAVAAASTSETGTAEEATAAVAAAGSTTEATTAEAAAATAAVASAAADTTTTQVKE
jgi:hypothetical protein